MILPKKYYSPTESDFGQGAHKKSRRTAHSVIYGDVSDTVDFEVTVGNTLVDLSTPTADPLDGDITFTYSLKNIYSDTSSINFQYSADGGTTWSDGTKGTGGDAETSLTTSKAGTSHTFVWDTVTDLGIDFKGNVVVRILGYDQDNQLGDFTSSVEIKLFIDNAPDSVSFTFPVSADFFKEENQQYTFPIADPNQGNSDLHVKLEVDTEEEFNSQGGLPLRVFESRLDQNGWEYDSDDAGAYVNIPHDGIPVSSDGTLVGNTCRFTTPTEDRLSVGSYHCRVTFGGVTS